MEINGYIYFCSNYGIEIIGDGHEFYRYKFIEKKMKVKK